MSAEGEAGLLGRIPSTGLSDLLGSSSGTDNLPPPTPDIWLAAITAAIETYLNLGKTAESPTTAVISSVLGQAQSKQIMSQPVVSSVLDFMETPQGTAVVSGSAILATRALTYIRAHANPPAAPPMPFPPPSVADEALISARTGSTQLLEAASQPSSPLPQLTTTEAVAVVEATNAVLRNTGEPALPGLGWTQEKSSDDRGGASTSTGDGGAGILGGGTSTGDGGAGILGTNTSTGDGGVGTVGEIPGQGGIPDEPGLEEDWLGQALAGIGVGSIVGKIGEAITSEVIGDIITNLNDNPSAFSPPADPDPNTDPGSNPTPQDPPIVDTSDPGSSSGDDGGSSGGSGGSITDGTDGSKDPEQTD
jgi:hypothetical protein